MFRLTAIILFCCIFSSNLRAQIGTFSFSGNVLYNDGHGIPWKFDFPFAMDGSPFFDTSFCTGSIQLLNGRTYSGLKLKLNLEQQKIIFEVEEGRAYVLSQQTVRIELACKENSKPVVFRSGFAAIEKQNDRSLYQVLDSGKVLLLKFVEIRFTDSKAYNSNDFSRAYRQLPSYYIWMPGKDLMKVPSTENELITLLADQRKALVEVIDKEKLKLRKENDLIKIIAKYNQLLTSDQ